MERPKPITICRFCQGEGTITTPQGTFTCSECGGSGLSSK